MQCLRWVVEHEHRKPFLQFVSTVLFCNCVELKYAPCCDVRFDLGKNCWAGATLDKKSRGHRISPATGFSGLRQKKMVPPTAHTASVLVHKATTGPAGKWAADKTPPEVSSGAALPRRTHQPTANKIKK